MRRQLMPSDQSASDKIFFYNGNGYLSLAPYEARTINTVTLYTDRATSGWYQLPNQDATTDAVWKPHPANKTEEGTYWSVTLPEIGRFHPYFDEPVTLLTQRNLGYQVTINATWGAGEVPSDVALAVWIAVANAWRNPEGYQSRSLGPLSHQDFSTVVPGEEEGLSLPRASRALLSGYRRRTGVR
jgi:hypothetical protein